MSERNPEKVVAGEAEVYPLVAAQRERAARLRREGQAAFKAMEGWSEVNTEEDWLRLCDQGIDDYRMGRFLIEKLGAERYLEPKLMAVLWGLRQQLREESGGTAAEAILGDLTLIGYWHVLRLNSWVGNFASMIEAEFFGGQVPDIRLNEPCVEDRLQRLGEELLPLLARANRLVLANLKAMKELRQTPAPAVAIARAEQVNVAQQQVNAVVLDADRDGGDE